MDKALIVTGIGDETMHLERATRHWPDSFGVQPVIHQFGWQGRVEEFDDRYEALRHHCYEIGALAVVGVSAGASAAALLAVENPYLAYVNVCGRLHQAGNNIYKFERYRHRAPLFVESVRRAEAVLDQLNPEKSLIFRARFDEMVPKAAAKIDGVKTITVPMPTHGFGIYYTLRWQGQRIARLAEAA